MTPPGGAGSVCRTAHPLPARGGHVSARLAFVLALALITTLWLMCGHDFLSRLDAVEADNVRLTARMSRAVDLLGVVRTQMLIGSVALRDALQDRTPGAFERHVATVHEARAAAAEALAQYAPLVDSAPERAMFQRLRGEIDAYWQAALPGLDWDEQRRAAESQVLLRTVFVPKRELIFKISESVQALRREEAAQQGVETLESYRAGHRRLIATIATALVLSVLVAAFVFVYIGRLEKRIEQEQLKDAENASDLQRLSARLVDAQEEERRTVARELHDEVGQALTALKMELAQARRAETGEQTAASIEDARAIADRVLHAVRDLSRLLHPRALDELGLAAALRSHVRDFSQRTGVPAEFLHDGTAGRPDPRVEIAAFRIVQEALTNVARHAGDHATCRVFLDHRSDIVRLTVEDDGRGFDPRAAAERPGVGLLGIQERVAACAGRCRLTTSPGAGTRLVVELPVRLAGSTEAERVRA